MTKIQIIMKFTQFKRLYHYGPTNFLHKIISFPDAYRVEKCDGDATCRDTSFYYISCCPSYISDYSSFTLQATRYIRHMIKFNLGQSQGKCRRKSYSNIGLYISVQKKQPLVPRQGKHLENIESIFSQVPWAWFCKKSKEF